MTVSSIAKGMFAITGNDFNELPRKATGGIVATTLGGTVRFIGEDGEIVSLTLQLGIPLPCSIVKVYGTTDGSTAITATGIHGFSI